MPISEYENNLTATKWKGMFVPALRKVQSQVHPALKVHDEALEYIESLIVQLMNHLCACQPRSVADVEERVMSSFPHPIEKWAIADAQAAVERGKKKNPVVLPADKVHALIKDILGFKVESQVSLYIVAVMEYISADILKLAGNYVKNIRHVEITCQDIKVALFADKVLMDMFHPDDVETSVEAETLSSQPALTYDEVVREMMLAEAQYIRDLNMIIKVFRAPFIEAKDLFLHEDISRIFSNITDIYDFSVTFLGLLEAAIEVADEGKPPAIGECFEEMAENVEFEVYYTYASEQTASASKQYRHLGIGGKLSELLLRTPVDEYFKAKGPGFKEAVQYCLPKMLMMPVHHCLHYFDLIKLLLRTSPDEDDSESLEQAQSALGPLQAKMERIVQSSGNITKRREDQFTKAQKRKSGAFRSAAVIMNELQRNIEGWEGRDISQSCTEVMKEGTLGKIHPNKRDTERYCFLLDGLLICCKQNTRHALTGPSPEYRLKEKYYIRKIEINNLDDTEDVKNAFEIVDRDQPKAVFTCKTEEDKNEWMSVLMTIYMRSTLDRMLDHLLLEEEKAIPLRMPSPDEYCFAVEDAEDNIVFEDGQGSSSNAPVIKGGTLIKLIERLTHHNELDELAMARGEPVVREDLNRFRKEYAQPVQLRVLNVIRHWVDNHCYDFERDSQLLTKLNDFLETVKGKAMRRWVESIKKVIARKTNSDNDIAPEITFEKEPPPIEWHIAACNDIERFDLLTVFQELNNFNGILEVVSAINSSPIFRLNHTFAPRKTDISLRSPGTKPSYLQSRLSITSQTSLRRSASQASYIYLPDSDMFSSTMSLSPSTPRTPLSGMSFLPPDSVSETISESPLLEDTEPDYVNIENFPEQEAPPDIPPRKPSNQTKPRAASVNGDRPSEHVTSSIRRHMSETPSIPRKPTKSVTIERCQNIAQDDDDDDDDDDNDNDAPPIPPREPSRGHRRTPPPIPPRVPGGCEPSTGNLELTNHEDTHPPALPPKTRRS
ncbi:Son of sevenless-like 1 [Stylophora pistillata]|uniref:Son of sevenless-like 1 n=1 Tax=Stylophora pistillata TaxID=50429 RepID=A0A2B4RJH8_STYPI|nr:Son of sevenless-like 1 [Stylophora pistillata]